MLKALMVLKLISTVSHLEVRLIPDVGLNYFVFGSILIKDTVYDFIGALIPFCQPLN